MTITNIPVAESVKDAGRALSPAAAKNLGEAGRILDSVKVLRASIPPL